MILYALRCECGHQYDQWFDNMADYDARKATLTCPACGQPTVSKAIMAPRVGKLQAVQPTACNPATCGNAACCCPMAQTA